MLDHAHVQRHFRRADPVLAQVIRRVGPMTLRPQRDRFKLLVGSIISQQISTAAARTIRGRLEERLGVRGVKPDSLAALSIDELRTLGISRQKAGYMLDLAQKCADGTIELAKIGRLDDETIIGELTQVKGIGRWSAQMFLMFGLGRPDVFPYDDLGVRSAIRQLYGLPEMPDKKTCLAIGQPWRPLSSVGTWYCWRYLEQLKK